VQDGAKARLDAFICEYAFESVVDVGKRGDGLSPLMCAATSGNVELVRTLLDEGADASAPYKGKPIGSVMLASGLTPLHVAAAAGRSATCVEQLLRHGASLDARAGGLGMTPLHCATVVSEDAIRALVDGCAAAVVPLNVGTCSLVMNANAINIAAFGGTPAMVRALLDLGADASQLPNHGAHVWTNACDNWSMDVATLDRIKCYAGVQHINRRFQQDNLKTLSHERQDFQRKISLLRACRHWKSVQRL
jgi:hypothetical protein